MSDASTGFDSVQGAGVVIEPAAWVRENAWVSTMGQYD
jgi:hypothetical protein